MAEIYAAGLPLPPIPDNLTLVQFILDTNHERRPLRPSSAPWIVDDVTGRTYFLEEVRVRVHGLANALKLQFGIKENDVVVLYSPNHIDYLIAIWAVHRLGAIISGANPTYTADELLYQVTATKARLIFAAAAALSTASTVARKAGVPDVNVLTLGAATGRTCVDDLVQWGLDQPQAYAERSLRAGEAKTKIAFYSFSSGTTGRPKAVAIPHYAPVANIIQTATHNELKGDYAPPQEQRYRPGDVALCVLPLYHIYGLICGSHFVLFAGMTAVMVQKFNFTEYLKSIVRHRVTHLYIVPPQAVLLCKHPATKNYDISCVRFVSCGAAPLSGELTKQLTALFPDAHVGQGYGMTETSTVITQTPISQRIGTLGSVGTLVPGVVARVVKSDGSLAKVGEEGELVVKAPSNALRYMNNKEATKETFSDGWVRTGDEVVFAENGDMFVVDRLKEIMKVRGFQVAPAELEGFLLDHPLVADACVVPVPDEYSGEVPLAFVVLSAGPGAGIRGDAAKEAAAKAQIAQYVAENKTAYKHLKGGVEFVDVIPKNPSGKLLRKELRAKARALRAGAKSKGAKQKAKL